MFPLLNVISLPGYLSEMVTQGVKPGQIQFYNTDYNAQSGDLVSSKVVAFGGAEGRRAVQQSGDHQLRPRPERSACPASSPGSSARCATASTRPRVARSTPPTDPETNSAYGATAGSCAFVRIIARAVDAAGPNPTRKDLAAAVENIGALDGGGVPGSFEPGKYTAPNALYKLRWHYPCATDKLPFDGHVHPPRRRDAFPFPN